MMAYMYFAKVNVNDEIFNVYDDPKVLQTLLVKLMGCINNSTKIDLPKDKGIIKFITIINILKKLSLKRELLWLIVHFPIIIKQAPKTTV